MSDDPFAGFGDYSDVEEEWVDHNESAEAQEKSTKIEEVEYDYGEGSAAAISFAGVGYSKNGKSLMGSLFPYLNQKWWTNSPAKAGKGIMIEDYPLTKQMIKTGIIPEIELLQVIDLGGTYATKSKMATFGALTKPLYEANMIKKCTIKVPGRVVKLADNSFKELAKKEIEIAKLKFDNEIIRSVNENDETIALLIDPYDELERLLNNMFRIVYEENIAPVRPLKGGQTKDFYGSSLDGIPQKFWYIRNSWFEDSLRMKADYPGISYDTFKIDPKPNDDPPYKIGWTKRSHYFLDIILWFDTSTYTAKVINRFEADQDRRKPVDFEKAKVIEYTPKRAKAIYEIMEALAPSIMGMELNEEGKYEEVNIWGD